MSVSILVSSVGSPEVPAALRLSSAVRNSLFVS